MFASYIQIAIRTLLKNKTHAIISVSGLALGFACVFLIALYLQDELSYDRYHEHARNIYRIAWEDDNPQTRTPHPMAQAMVQDFPEVVSAVSLSPLYASGLTRETHSLRNPASDTRYDEQNLLAVDTTFFDVFSFPLVKGNPATALKQPNGILLSESLAKKYFPNEDALGKHLAVDAEDYLVEVVGVFKDVPENSHFHFDVLVSYVREKSLDPGDPFYSWSDFGHYNYIRLRDGADPAGLEKKLMTWMRQYLNVSDDQYEAIRYLGYRFRLQPLTDIHLKSQLRWELEPNGNIDYIYLLFAAAILTMTIAVVNFVNLGTARSVERGKEIGVRKTLGASRRQVSAQFFAESVMLTLLAVGLALVIVETALPLLNTYAGLNFRIDYTSHGLWFLFPAVFIGLLAGIYPALYLSTLRPHVVLKGRPAQSPGGARFRSGLIVFQFFMSMVLISSAAVIYKQLSFIRNKHLGFEKEAVLVIPVKNEDGMERFDAFRQELERIEGVYSVSAASNLPGGQFNQHYIASVQFPEEVIAASEIYVDDRFFETLDVTTVEGRTFRPLPARDSGAFVLNETAARQLGLGSPAAGKEIIWKHFDTNTTTRGTVVGVVKDFHFRSLHEPIRPLIFISSRERFNHVIVKMETSELEVKIDAIRKVYAQFEPVFGFEFSFLEDQLNAQYRAEQHTGIVLGIFTVIAVLIACFGLFGMSLLTFQQRIRELSVRKVLGASLSSLLFLLVGNFTKLIALAVLLATPLSWLIMDRWLENFTYQAGVQPLIFLAGGLVLVAIAWITLSYFVVKASRLNPAETLKTE